MGIESESESIFSVRPRRRTRYHSQMKPKVYVETSVVSYLTARPSRDVIVLAHQEVTRTWWQQRSRYRLFVPRLVEEEIARGDATAAAAETTREFDPLLGNLFRKLAGTKPKRQPQIEVSPVAR